MYYEDNEERHFVKVKVMPASKTKFWLVVIRKGNWVSLFSLFGHNVQLFLIENSNEFLRKLTNFQVLYLQNVLSTKTTERGEILGKIKNENNVFFVPTSSPVYLKFHQIKQEKKFLYNDLIPKLKIKFEEKKTPKKVNSFCRNGFTENRFVPPEPDVSPPQERNINKNSEEKKENDFQKNSTYSELQTSLENLQKLKECSTLSEESQKFILSIISLLDRLEVKISMDLHFGKIKTENINTAKLKLQYINNLSKDYKKLLQNKA